MSLVDGSLSFFSSIFASWYLGMIFDEAAAGGKRIGRLWWLMVMPMMLRCVVMVKVIR